MDFSMPKARKRKKPAIKLEAEMPTLERASKGNFERDFVTHAESNTKAMVHRDRESTILQKWIRDGEQGFDEPACRFIADCQSLWRKTGNRSITARYGEHTAPSTGDAGHTQQDALDDLRYWRSLLGGANMDAFWSVFENVVRWNEPAGVAGSSMANNPAQAIQSAKLITGMVASVLAARLGY